MFLVILGSPYCGISATIRIGREMLCLPYAEFFDGGADNVCTGINGFGGGDGRGKLGPIEKHWQR